MSRPTITCRQSRRKVEHALRVLSLCLAAAAIILACGLCLYSKSPTRIERPVLLVLAALFVMPAFKSELLMLLQKLTAFYLVCATVSELSGAYIAFPFSSINIKVSYSVLILLLCATGYLIARISPRDVSRAGERGGLLSGWVLAFVFIAAHMIVLWAFLEMFYGYGYQHDLSVLGGLCRYLLLFVFLNERLSNLRFRQCVGLLLVLCFAVMQMKA